MTVAISFPVAPFIGPSVIRSCPVGQRPIVWLPCAEAVGVGESVAVGVAVAAGRFGGQLADGEGGDNAVL